MNTYSDYPSLDNVLYYYSLYLGLDPEELCKDDKNYLSNLVNDLPIETLKVMDKIGGAMKEGFSVVKDLKMPTFHGMIPYQSFMHYRFEIYRGIQEEAARRYIAKNDLSILKDEYLNALPSVFDYQIGAVQTERFAEIFNKLAEMERNILIN